MGHYEKLKSLAEKTVVIPGPNFQQRDESGTVHLMDPSVKDLIDLILSLQLNPDIGYKAFGETFPHLPLGRIDNPPLDSLARPAIHDTRYTAHMSCSSMGGETRGDGADEDSEGSRSCSLRQIVEHRIPGVLNCPHIPLSVVPNDLLPMVCSLR